MGNRSFYLILVLFICFHSITINEALGQKNGRSSSSPIVSSFEDLERSKKPAAIRLNKTALAVGFYQPTFDYWNDETIWQLKGSVMPSASISFYHFNLFRSRLEAGYFVSSWELTREPSWGEEQLSVQLIPLSFTLDLPVSISEKVQAYVGGGVSLMFITNRYISPDSDRSVSGSSTIPLAIIGAEYLLGHYTIGFEGRYFFGSYIQKVQMDPVSSPERKEVDISGPYMGLNFSYLF